MGLSLPGAALMTIIGGFLLGQWVGTGAVVIGATLGASVLFVSARSASQDLLAKKMGPWAKKMQAGFQKNAFSYLLTLRLIPLFPFVIINLVAALLQLPFRIFFWGTFLGIIPGSFVYTSLGVALQDLIQSPNFSADLIMKPSILLALTGLGLLSLLPLLYQKYGQKKGQKKK